MIESQKKMTWKETKGETAHELACDHQTRKGKVTINVQALSVLLENLVCKKK